MEKRRLGDSVEVGGQGSQKLAYTKPEVTKLALDQVVRGGTTGLPPDGFDFSSPRQT